MLSQEAQRNLVQHSWLEEVGRVTMDEDGAEEEGVVVEGDEEELSRLRQEGWQLMEAGATPVPAGSSVFPFEGQLVEVTVDGGEVVRGRVRAYLPATAEEPTALWKVWLEEGYGRQDLEEEELRAALIR